MAIKKYNVLDNENQHVSVPFNYTRGSAMPIDNSSVWPTLADALNYANGTTIGYGVPFVGQIITVNDDTGVSAYMIEDTNGSLKQLASGGLTDDIRAKLNELSNVTLPLSVQTLLSNLSIDVRAEAGTSDVLSSYIISQGGVDKPVKIDIPRDKVIEKASVVKFNTDAEAQAATGDPTAKAGTYLKLEIKNLTKAVYVPIPELASVYQGYDSKTINLSVVHGSGEEYTISAYVKDGSIGFEHLTNELSNYVKTVVDRESADRTAIETLSGDSTVEGSVKKALKDAKDYANENFLPLSGGIVTGTLSLSDENSNYIEIDSGLIQFAGEGGIYGDFAEVEVSAVTGNTLKAKSSISILSTYNYGIAGHLYEDRITKVTDIEGLSVIKNTWKVDPLTTHELISSSVVSILLPTESGKIALVSDVQGLVGSDTDLSTANTIYGAKAYANQKFTDAEAKAAKDVADEAAARAALSTALSVELSAEISARAEGDSALAKSIAAETTARSEAIQSLSVKLSTEIDALSTSLSTTVDAKIAEATASVGNLSTALSNEVKGLSTALSTEIKAEKDARVTAIADLSVKLSGEVNALSSKLSAEVDAEEAARIAAITSLSASLSVEISSESYRAKQAESKITSDFAVLSNDIGLSAASSTNVVVTKKDIADLAGAMHFRGITTTDLSSGLSVIPEGTGYYDKDANPPKVPTAGDIVINASTTKEFVWAGQKWSATGTIGKWYQLGDDSIYLLKADFESWRDTTLENRLTGIEAYADDISSDTQNKIKIGTGHFDGTTWTDDLTNKTSLSVVKIADEDYYKLIAAGKQNDDVLYVVSSDYINGHDLRIINVGNAISSTDAVNLSAMNAAIEAAKQTIVANSLSGVTLNGESFTVENNVANLTISCINCGTAD